MRKRVETFSLPPEKIVGGIIIGALLGTAAAFIMSKRGRELACDIAEKCSDMTDDLKDYSHKFVDRSSDLAHGLSDRLLRKKRHSGSHTNWLIGGIAGGILGISTAAFLSTESGKDFYEKMANTFESMTDKTHHYAGQLNESAQDAIESWEKRIVNWVKLAQNLLHTVKGTARNGKVPFNGEAISSVVDWAIMGAKLLQSLKR